VNAPNRVSAAAKAVPQLQHGSGTVVPGRGTAGSGLDPGHPQAESCRIPGSLHSDASLLEGRAGEAVVAGSGHPPRTASGRSDLALCQLLQSG